MKKSLKLNFKNVFDDDESFSPENCDDTTPKKVNYNRGNLYKDKIKKEKLTTKELIIYNLTTPNKDYDLSYHWFEKCNNLKTFEDPIIFSLNESFSEPVRDLECEFELVKLITEDSYHKENLIELPKSLKKLNRYPDVLPCKFIIKIAIIRFSLFYQIQKIYQMKTS